MIWWYYLIQLTWGLPLTALGMLSYFLLVGIFGCYSYRYRNMICIVIPWNFGGVNLGMFAIHGEKNYSVVSHEYGHSIQNLWWGWLMPFIIALPSAVRYWYREIRYAINKPPTTKYDDIWFEGQATALGKKASVKTWSWL